MKKNLGKIIIIGIVIVALVAVIYAGFILNAQRINEEKHFIELNFSKLEEKINNKESFILVVTQTTCSHCAEYKPVLKKVLAEYDIYAYYIEKDLLSDEDAEKLKNIAEVEGTPATIFITQGQELSTTTRLTGTKTRDAIIDRFKAMGYIEG